MRETLYQVATNLSHTGSHRTRHPLVGNGEATTAPDQVEAFSSDVSNVTTAADGYRLAVHSNLEFACTAMAADRNVRSLGHNVAFGAEAARVLASEGAFVERCDEEIIFVTYRVCVFCAGVYNIRLRPLRRSEAPSDNLAHAMTPILYGEGPSDLVLVHEQLD
jgi:hypothetical protein